jgi:hypothetical protein
MPANWAAAELSRGSGDPPYYLRHTYDQEHASKCRDLKYFGSHRAVFALFRAHFLVVLTGPSPGPVETPIIDKQFPAKEASDASREEFKARIPLGRMGRAEEVASAALFLASDESSFISGIELPVDGGLVAV